MNFTKPILANVHIEKAAGQTFISILENNFTYRHSRVKPLLKEDHGVFSAASMKKVMRINPFVQVISGHSVVPFSDIDSLVPGVQYITIFREPISRYISHYQYWIEKMTRSISFEEFLSIRDLHNFQTKKIAGCDDLSKALYILNNKFFAVGIVEELDTFLRILQAKLFPRRFDIYYRAKNVGDANLKSRLTAQLDQYKQEIAQANNIDTKLYEYVKQELVHREKLILNRSHDLVADALPPRSERSVSKVMANAWKIYRNFYYSPIVKTIRLLNGLSPNGSY